MDFKFTMIAVLFVLLGLSLLIGAIVLGLRKWRRIKRSVPTTGVVVSNQTSVGSRQFDFSPKSTLYKPTVRFQTSDGRVIDYTPETSNNVSNYSIGQTVPVYYNPQKPEEAIVGTAYRLWHIFLVFGLCGGICAFVGTIFIVSIDTSLVFNMLGKITRIILR